MPRTAPAPAAPVAASRGRKPSFIARVQSNGSILINKTYLENFNPGDEFRIKVSDGKINLVQV